ncbi:hypothetical protein A3H55_02585 [Candidatus Kuenenbacteria bacterium RIFCSPLOWO2_02_FULL_42_16]|uniref:Uncharacterized protein n=3 Tax=Candidatus Kueneniibacteriota TaxID=1752740 RepID=A0A1F6G063_9BACT|nr:MAG: hypothetical protein A3H55_02585 [Candidatus Kuenenbacteria bacterium RIFCSPLOWO2_02_FULL_42_16]
MFLGVLLPGMVLFLEHDRRSICLVVYFTFLLKKEKLTKENYGSLRLIFTWALRDASENFSEILGYIDIGFAAFLIIIGIMR